MPALNMAEQAKLRNYGVDAHYTKYKNKYDSVGKSLVQNFRSLIASSARVANGSSGVANISEDEVAELIYD